MGFGFGKVILFGEHGVVYGHPAIAAALERGVHADASLTEGDDRLEIAPWALTVRPEPGSDEPLERAYALVRARYADTRPVVVRARVGIPAGAGLGCSAALGVAVIAALDELHGVARTGDERAAACLDWERVFHGNPSGVDNAVAACGGLVEFRRGAPIARVTVRTPITLVVGDTGEPASTKETVADVACQRGRAPARIDANFDAIAAIVHNARLALRTGALSDLGQLMDLNHTILASMMLSTERLERLRAAAKAAGALGSKLTGGGGGGCMIALAADTEGAARIEAAIADAGGAAFVTRAGLGAAS
ncbi:MAG: mevalonate kinase [Myxococcales bacterium]|nr:mevalonate kinase [Myxococcales bacterium]